MRWVFLVLLVFLVSCAPQTELEWKVNVENEKEVPIINTEYIAPEVNISEIPENIPDENESEEIINITINPDEIIEVPPQGNILTGARFYLGTKYGTFHLTIPDQNTAVLNISDDLYVMEVLIVGETSSRDNKLWLTINGERLKPLGEKETDLFGDREFVYVMEVFYRE